MSRYLLLQATEGQARHADRVPQTGSHSQRPGSRLLLCEVDHFRGSDASHLKETSAWCHATAACAKGRGPGSAFRLKGKRAQTAVWLRYQLDTHSLLRVVGAGSFPQRPGDEVGASEVKQVAAGAHAKQRKMMLKRALFGESQDVQGAMQYTCAKVKPGSVHNSQEEGPCGPFLPLQNWNYSRMDSTKAVLMLSEGLEHLDFAMKVFEWQVRRGRWGLIEHPAILKAWQERCVRRVLELPGVQRVRGDQCMYGLQVGGGANRKTTDFMVNGDMLAARLQKRCDGGHQHVPLLHGLPKYAQEYSNKLCVAMLKGAIQEKIKAERAKLSVTELEKWAGPSGWRDGGGGTMVLVTPIGQAISRWRKGGDPRDTSVEKFMGLVGKRLAGVGTSSAMATFVGFYGYFSGNGSLAGDGVSSQ